MGANSSLLLAVKSASASFSFSRRMFNSQNCATLKTDTNLIHRVVENGCFAQLLKNMFYLSCENPKMQHKQTTHAKSAHNNFRHACFYFRKQIMQCRHDCFVLLSGSSFVCRFPALNVTTFPTHCLVCLPPRKRRKQTVPIQFPYSSHTVPITVPIGKHHSSHYLRYKK